MSTDLLTLALAAAMPLMAFALYTGFRAFGDRRARRREHSASAGQVRARSTSSQRRPAANPIDMARPMDSRPAIRVADPSPAVARTATGGATPAEPGRRILAKFEVSRPEPAGRKADRAEPARPILAKLVVSRPNEHGSSNGSVPSVSPAGAAQAVREAGDARPAGETTPRVVQPVAAPVIDRAPAPASVRSGSAVSESGAGRDARVPTVAAAASLERKERGPGLMSRSLHPFRSALGRGDGKGSSNLPAWPQPERRDEPFPPLVATTAGPGPCPFCAESRERGAWFCRRCRQPVDPRAVAATSAMSLTTAATPPLASLDSRQDVRPTGPAAPAPTSAPLPPSADRAPRPAEASAAPGPAPSTAGPTIVRPTIVVARGRQPAPPDIGHEAKPVPPDVNGPSDADPAIRVAATAGDGAGSKVNLNHATVAELSGLRGIGPVTAERIIAARKDGTFPTIDALVDRKIVGRSVVDRLRAQVTV